MSGELSSGTWTEVAPGGGDVLHVRVCQLEVVSGADAGTSKTIGASAIQIGRTGTDLVLTDRKVSGIHAEIRLEDQGYRIRDLGSTNGTWLNGARIVEAFLEPGASFTVGTSVVRFAPLASSVAVPISSETRLGGLVGRSIAMRRIFAAIDRVAGGDARVLVTGESGTGKELVAEAIHERSPRRGGPFVVVDCGAVPAHLFDSQLFGHERGAFTGAVAARAGSFEEAHRGTLFLDEVGELPFELQAKLLRAVETRQVRRVGGNKTIECDVRVIAATNRDLAVEINRGSFRSDLYYRLAVVHLHMPPLRERMDDLEPLIDVLAGDRRAQLPEEFLAWAQRNAWPGNVRQLRNSVQRALALGEWLPDRFELAMSDGARPEPLLTVDTSIPFREAKRRVIETFDRRYLTTLLAEHGGSITAAARAAGVTRMSIYNALARLGLAPGKDPPDP